MLAFPASYSAGRIRVLFSHSSSSSFSSSTYTALLADAQIVGLAISSQSGNAMPARRSHQKSRRGCQQCKQAHIKCNEEGPPCGRCSLRSTPCEYASSASTGSAQQDSSISPAKNGVVAPSKAVVNGISHAEEPLFPSSARLLELQLVHRWSTVTYKSMVTPAAGDDYVWLMKLPVWGLQYDFVLNGLLALTAFEVASSSTGENREQYVHAATEYQHLALRDFRKHLAEVTEHSPDAKSYEPVLAFSLTLMGLALASAQFTHMLPPGQRDAVTTSMVDNTITHYELIRGCGTILGDQGEEYLASNPYVQKLTRFEELPSMPVDSPSAAMFAKLNEVNERRLTRTVAEAYEARVRHVKYFETCKKAIGLLQEMQAKCAGDQEGYQGYILGWLNLAGDEYVSAIKDGDQVSLLVLMHWGAMVERVGGKIWWAKRFGRLLVEEIATRVGEDSEDGLLRDIIASAIETAVIADD